jgi:hypothetical protein
MKVSPKLWWYAQKTFVVHGTPLAALPECLQMPTSAGVKMK